jgi:hydrogenase nickel incorporation protein HypB
MTEIKIVKNVLEANESIASQNQEILDEHGVFAINIMASPGAGKTSLILQTLANLRNKLRIGIIEGDFASRVDTDKVKSYAEAAIQINTKGAPESCSLIAAMIENSLKDLPLDDINLLLIENVGNLLCPAEFTLGEHKRVVISSSPEGDDKPIKYPLIFSDADAVIINKLDLAPYVDFNVTKFRQSIEGLNPTVKIFEVSCKTGAGIADWCSWLLQEIENNSVQRTKFAGK